MRLAATAMLAALALVAAGCGGSDSNDAAVEDTTAIETTAEGTTTEDVATTETTVEEATTEDTTSEDATTEAISTEESEDTTTGETTIAETGTTSTVDEDAIAQILGSEGCAQLVTVGSKLAEAMSGVTGDTSGIEKTRTFLDGLAQDAPEELRDDFAVLADAWTAIVEAYGDLGLKPGQTPTAEMLQKLSEKGEELSKTLDDPRFEQASENISAWADEHCTATP